MSITGLGPHGEKSASPLALKLTDAEAAEAAACRFSVAVVLHTTRSDWARQQLAGISGVIGQYQAAIVDVVDCGFEPTAQIEAFARLTAGKADAIISMQLGNGAVADAHRRVHAAAKRLVLLDNAPTGLAPGRDYVCVVSADNFGLGEIAAQLLSAHVAPDQAVGMLTYGVDVFATNEREIAFRKWLAKHRPDVKTVQCKFPSLDQVEDCAAKLLGGPTPLAGLFAVWDEPAIIAVKALDVAGLSVPVTTIDLGNAVATNMARGGLIKAVGAQKPYDQGKAAASATLLTLLGRGLPSWIALPGLAVTRDNVVEAYQSIWHAPAPADLLSARRI